MNTRLLYNLLVFEHSVYGLKIFNFTATLASSDFLMNSTDETHIYRRFGLCKSSKIHVQAENQERASLKEKRVTNATPIDRKQRANRSQHLAFSVPQNAENQYRYLLSTKERLCVRIGDDFVV